MAVSYMDFTSPSVQYFFDLRNNRSFTKDNRNYINALGVQQLNTLGNVSLLDIYLSRANVVEPHVHQNASELVYCIAGAATVSILNPFTKTVINVNIVPGQVANIPQGWFHWEIATVDDTHLLAIFDAPVPEFIAVSDFLRLVPRNTLAHTYCLDEALIAKALAPIKSTVTIGPPADCQKNQRHAPHEGQPQGQPPQPQPGGGPVPYPGYAQPSAPQQRYPDYPGIGNGFPR
ncbi:cupin domain-containing protein [Cohnella sp. GCM10027633]|uniref:cupin domain-containing protein n=1 Tax=unclassified Cohnella TaxID=2636738 RepID=UPI00362E7A4C